MSITPSKTWAPANREIIDIGGSKLDNTLDSQLHKAFKENVYFPKEIAYTMAMEKWCAIADTSYQTFDEIKIIESTAGGIVAGIPATGGTIVDLGAANSPKFEPYVKSFVAQKKKCTYVALDICLQSLTEHIAKASAKFPNVLCIGLWGDFKQGDLYFNNIPGPRLFLSLGSIFYNAPDDMCLDRCSEFKKHMHGSPHDRLIVGQDGPSATESSNSHKAYGTKEYHDFFTSYLAGVQRHAGIVADPTKAWSYESKMNASMHYFKVVAQHEMICTRYGNLVVRAGTEYTMFPSWKRGASEIHRMTLGLGLRIATLGKAPNSGMHQYIIGVDL
ncbi:hypothetical protein FHETE_2447 [Fusarium heterosporum]|uniref:Histidine-specific methyltransferase SAM-dependent domain-containing protein n=1 Tax=Fusarium heterosporum TaxID=42747 RepID=A0A8H5WZL8_FUSHE|nr:hypothetical protein FHETE_2447 [Fusarium heterosporum]